MKYKLEDICLKITDGSHYSPSDDISSDIPMLSVKDMEEFDFNYNNCKHISEEEYDKMLRNDCVPKLYDVLVSKDGSYLKEMFVNEKETKKAILSSIAIFRPNQEIVDPYFLCYLLKTPMILNYVKDNCVSGSALPRIILRDFKGIELEIPNLEIQKKIVKIIKNINSKIRNDNEINNNLYELIKNNYETLISNCDWEKVELGIIANITSGKRPIDKLEIGKYPVIGANGVMAHTSEFNFDEDLIVTGRVGTLGVIKRYSDKIWASDNTLVVQTKYLNYLENYMKSIDYYSLNRGSTQPLLTQGDLKKQIIMFNEESVLKFEKENQIFINKIRNNEKETKYLEQLRDTLLPKLMNGEIDLDNIEI